MATNNADISITAAATKNIKFAGTDSVNINTAQSFNFIPTGTILTTVTATIPTGYLYYNGQTVFPSNTPETSDRDFFLVLRVQNHRLFRCDFYRAYTKGSKNYLIQFLYRACFNSLRIWRCCQSYRRNKYPRLSMRLNMS